MMRARGNLLPCAHNRGYLLWSVIVCAISLPELPLRAEPPCVEVAICFNSKGMVNARRYRRPIRISADTCRMQTVVIVTKTKLSELVRAPHIKPPFDDGSSMVANTCVECRILV